MIDLGIGKSRQESGDADLPAIKPGSLDLSQLSFRLGKHLFSGGYAIEPSVPGNLLRPAHVGLE
jgi:hypothetical protein